MSGGTVSPGRAVVDVLLGEGVRHVFGLPGGHVLGIYDALYETPSIRHVLVRHEQAAASLAAAHAQLTGEPGVCLVTAGPGCTNLLTGIAEAYVGSLPIVAIAGRGATVNAHRGAAQEVDTHRIFAPVTKSAVLVDSGAQIPEAVADGFRIARGGRPGPVLIDIPRDLLDEQIEARTYMPAGSAPRPAADATAIEATVDLLLGAERPILIAGGGTVASGAFGELRALAEHLALPVLTSLAGRGSIPDDHPLSAGGLGTHRNRLSSRLLREADVVLGLGTRFEEMETNWREGAVPAPDAAYVQVDIEPAELGRSVPARIGIAADVRTTLEQLLAELGRRGVVSKASRLGDDDRVRAMRDELDAIERDFAALADTTTTPIHPVRVIHEVRRTFPRETTVAIDVGCITQHIAGGAPFFKVFEPRSLIVPSSFYGMGFATAGLPAAKLVHPDRPAVGFTGDGSFQMVMMSVLPTAAELGLGVTWCVLNDGALGSIRDIQEHKLGNRVIATEFAVQPDFATIAEASGCHGERIEHPGDVAGSLERALAANAEGRPAVLDFVVARERMLQSLEHYGFYPEQLVERARRSPAEAAR